MAPDSGEHKVRPYLRAFAGEKENLALDLEGATDAQMAQVLGKLLHSFSALFPFYSLLNIK